MYLHAETVTVDDDEGRFTLEILDGESGKRLTVNIHDCDLDAFYDQVKSRLGPYLQEAAEARTAVAAGVSREEYLRDEYAHERMTGQHAPFVCSEEDVDESGDLRGEGAYPSDDPKHPDYHSVHADLWDNRDKTAGLE